MFMYGISYAIASLSCTVGPFLRGHRRRTWRGDSLVAGAYRSTSRMRAVFAPHCRGARGGHPRLASSEAVDRMATNCAVCQPELAARLLVGRRPVHRLLRALYEIRLFTGSGNPVDPVVTGRRPRAGVR